MGIFHHIYSWVLFWQLSSHLASGSQPPSTDPLVIANLEPQYCPHPFRLSGSRFQVEITLWLKEYLLISSLGWTASALMGCTHATCLVLGPGPSPAKLKDTPGSTFPLMKTLICLAIHFLSKKLPKFSKDIIFLYFQFQHVFFMSKITHFSLGVWHRGETLVYPFTFHLIMSNSYKLPVWVKHGNWRKE